jgi:hypothetical protein
MGALRKEILEIVGRSSLFCSVAVHSSGIIASGSEDLFAELWRDVASSILALCGMVMACLFYVGYVPFNKNMKVPRGEETNIKGTKGNFYLHFIESIFL